jgi:hypothetical protein
MSKQTDFIIGYSLLVIGYCPSILQAHPGSTGQLYPSNNRWKPFAAPNLTFEG